MVRQLLEAFWQKISFNEVYRLQRQQVHIWQEAGSWSALNSAERPACHAAHSGLLLCTHHLLAAAVLLGEAAEQLEGPKLQRLGDGAGRGRKQMHKAHVIATMPLPSRASRNELYDHVSLSHTCQASTGMPTKKLKSAVNCTLTPGAWLRPRGTRCHGGGRSREPFQVPKLTCIPSHVLPPAACEREHSIERHQAAAQAQLAPHPHLYAPLPSFPVAHLRRHHAQRHAGAHGDPPGSGDEGAPATGEHREGKAGGCKGARQELGWMHGCQLECRALRASRAPGI